MADQRILTVPAGQQVARLLISCPDRPGIIAAVTTFLKDHGANITDLDQHSTLDGEGEALGVFFMRLEFQTVHAQEYLAARFDKEVAQPCEMDWQLNYASRYKRMALLASRYDHALLEVLWRVSRGELALTVPFIISNHLDLKVHADYFNVPFYHFPVTPNNKQAIEQNILALCADKKVEGLILARYMQILSPEFVAHYPNKIINIHHSFLPAFIGANPYQQAYERGVKLIGATAHYVTNELDMGPIIAQEVVNVSHRLDVTKLKELGQYAERTALARAIKAHVEDRIIVDGNKTVVFNLH